MTMTMPTMNTNNDKNNCNLNAFNTTAASAALSRRRRTVDGCRIKPTPTAPVMSILAIAIAACLFVPLVAAEENNNNDDTTSSYSSYYDGSDDGVCKVYDSHDIFTFLVQFVLAGAAVASLYIKRLNEHPRRTFVTWFLDVSKQCFGAGYAHVLNMLIAGTIVSNVRTGRDGTANTVLEDECAWYGMSYLLDTTLGLLLAVLFLQGLERAAHRYHWTALQHSGVYVGSTAIPHWTSQVVAWVAILTIVKLLIYAFIWVCSEPLAYVGYVLFAPFQGYKHLELIFVMILFPGVMNVVYFWIADTYLQADADQTAAHEVEGIDSSLSYNIATGSGGDQKKESLLGDENFVAISTAPSWSALAATEMVNATPNPNANATNLNTASV